jgi:predicted MFS family arabinose efflux permease
MLAVLLSFMGQFTLFTYLRPFLEQVTGVNVSMLSAMLLIVGLTGLIGTSLVRKVLDGRLHVTLAVIPVGCTISNHLAADVSRKGIGGGALRGLHRAEDRFLVSGT